MEHNQVEEAKKLRRNGHKTNWLQVLKNHFTDLKGAGWTDENLTTMDGLLDDILLDTGTTIPGTITTMQGNVTDILADTDELQGDWADGGRLDLLIDAIKAVTDALPDAGALNDLADILLDTGTTIPGTITTMQGNVTDILADTDELQGDWADGGRLDLLLDAIKAITDTLTLAALEAEAVDALESFDLDHLINVALGAALDTFVIDDSILGFILAKADVSNFDRTTMSLEALQLAIAGIAGVNTYMEQIPDVDFDLDAITEDLASDPPGAPAANSVVDIDVNAGDTFVLRSLFVKVNSFGTGGNKLTFKLWTLLNTAVTMVDEVDVTSLGIQNLADIFGLQEVHGDGIWITVQSDATPGSDDADCEGTYKYAKAT